MERMTAERAFTARELHSDGLLPWRIADLIDVDEAEVLRVLNGGAAEPVHQDLPSPTRPPPPPAPPAVVDPNAWPPPADASTAWESVRPADPRTWGTGDAVQVRPVRLWGKRVLINASDEVWCPSCQQFKTTDQLSHRPNACPVGLTGRSGVWTVTAEEMEAEGSAAPDPGNFWRMQW